MALSAVSMTLRCFTANRTFLSPFRSKNNPVYGLVHNTSRKSNLYGCGRKVRGYSSRHQVRTMQEDEARALVMQLTEESRGILREEITRYEKSCEELTDLSQVKKITARETVKTLIFFGLPFLAFGVMDNTIMIFAGDIIERKISSILVISTMAAAALGNLVSDVAGVLSTSYVEKIAGKATVLIPNVTPAQTYTFKYRMASVTGKVVGVMLGCLLGMSALFFIKDDDDDDDKTDDTKTDTDKTDNKTDSEEAGKT